MSTKAQRKASAKYDRNHTRSIMFKFNTTNDADILAKLDEVGNEQGYIKSLIRENICGNGSILSIDAIKLLMLPIAQKYEIKKATLFGSYARGEASEDSDIDLLIECDSIRNMKDYLALKESITSATGKNVDLVMADALHSENTRAAKRLIEHIERDQLIVYEKNQWKQETQGSRKRQDNREEEN